MTMSSRSGYSSDARIIAALAVLGAASICLQQGSAVDAPVAASTAVAAAAVPMRMRDPTDEERLLNRLFVESAYNPTARPVINSSKTVDVRMQLSLLQIQELNLKSQVFTTTALLILEWYDERLAWSTNQYPMYDVVVEARKLWRPEFAAINGADDIYGDYGQFRAIIEHSGKVHWEPGGVFKTICEIDITYYPFDEQCCRIIFGAWSYHISKMNLTNMEDSVNMDSFETNGEWEIFKTQAIRNEFSLANPTEKFANVEFLIFIRRRYTFYVLNVILPSLMTSIILLSVFFSTPAQKVQIGVVVLLSFRIFLLNVTDSIPKTSDHIPLLGVYLACTMAITTLSMVLTVSVLNIYGISDRPVPRWANTLVTVYIAGLVCMRNKTTTETKRRDDDVKYTTLLGNSPSNASGNSLDSDPGGKTTVWVKSDTCHSLDGTNSPLSQRCLHVKSVEPPAAGIPPSAAESAEETRKREAIWGKEWKKLAEIVDRLFFWVFLLGIVITTLLLLHPLVRSHNLPTEDGRQTA